MAENKDYTTEIKRLEDKYAKIDLWAAKRKELLAAKLLKLKKLQASR